MVDKSKRASVRVMLAGVTLIATGRFAHDARDCTSRGGKPDWMVLLGA